MNNKPIVNWTDEQIEQITKDLTTYLKRQLRYEDIIGTEISNFKSKDPSWGDVSTMYVTIEYIFYTPWWEEDEDNPDPRDGTKQTMGITIYADGTQCLLASIYNVFTSQERTIFDYVQKFFAELWQSEA